MCQENRLSSPVISLRRTLRHWKPDFAHVLSGVWLLTSPLLTMRQEWRFFVRKKNSTDLRNIIFRMRLCSTLPIILNPISVSLKDLWINWSLFLIWRINRSTFLWLLRPWRIWSHQMIPVQFHQNWSWMWFLNTLMYR